MRTLRLIFQIIAQDSGLEKIKSYRISLFNNWSQPLQGQYMISYKYGTLCASQDFQVSSNNQIFLYDLPNDLCSDKPIIYFNLAQQQIKYQIRPKTIASKIHTCKNNRNTDFYIDLQMQTLTTNLPSLRLDKSYSHNQYQQSFTEFKDIIDLHLNKDVKIEDVRRNNNIILEAQVEVFMHQLYLAQSNYLPSLTIIHGKGDGILRQHIHNFMKKEYPNLKIQSHYGGGRMIIYLR